MPRAGGSPGPRRSFNVVGLFAGIGGIELGLSRAGHHARLVCELDAGASAVLEARFRDVDRIADVREMTSLPGDVELLAAGFPCQDLSQAGKTAGLAGDSSSLVADVLRLLASRKRRGRPVPWVLLENVPFMLQLSRGRALEVIIRALESLGYGWAYRVVDTLSFGLPQRRERVFLLAAMHDDPREVLFADDEGPARGQEPRPDLAFGFYWTEGLRGLGAAVDAVPTLKGGSTIGIPSPPAVILPSGQVVTPGIEDAERMQGFEPGWTEPALAAARRGHRWKLVGNAVTVDVAHWIGERLAAPGRYDGTWDVPLPQGAPWPSAAWSLGGGRFTANVSTRPVSRPRPHLHSFLRGASPLSAKATAGFLERLGRSSLRRPRWFDERLDAHLMRMSGGEPLVAVEGR